MLQKLYVSRRAFGTHFSPSQHKLFMDLKPMRRHHPIYSMRGIEDIEETHKVPETLKEKLAKKLINLMRGTYDLLSGYNPEQMKESKWLTRCIFLEAVAGVPGMVGGMTRHL